MNEAWAGIRRWAPLLLWAGAFIFLNSTSPLAAVYPRTPLTDRVDALFAGWDRAGSPGAALGIIRDGRLIYARGYGMANLEYDVPITPQSVFRTGSVGKQFTAICAAVLAERGRLSLDDDIRKHLPEMPAYERPITVRHLIHHTSGLRDYLELQGLAGRVDDYFFTKEEGIALLARQKGLNFPPGEKYQYSNSGYFLLGEIVARVRGISLREFMRREIFEPLGMKSTHLHDDRNFIVRNRATGYAPRDGGYRIAMTQLEIVGDGSVFTSIEDFLLWDRNFYDNRLGRRTRGLIDMILTPGRLNDGSAIDYAFGLRIDTYRGLRRVSHSGSYMGYRATYRQFPDQRFSVVVFANLSTFDPSRLADAVADIYLADLFTGPPPPAEPRDDGAARAKRPRAVRLPPPDLARYAGDYYSGELDVVARIRPEGGRLRMRLVRTLDDLTPVGSDRFLATYTNDDADEAAPRTLEFLRDPAGALSGFLMHADPIHDIRFERIPQSD